VAWSIEPTQIALHIPGLRDLVGIQSLDGIIWTLDIEIKFYVVCALGAPLFRRLSLRLLWLSAIVGMCSVLLWCAMLAIGQGNVTAETLAVDLAYMLFMFIGTTFYMLHSRKLQPMPAASIIVALLSLHTLLLLPETGQALYNVNYAIALAVFAFAYAMRGRFGANRVTDFFAAISYPLYAVHAVMGWAILRVLTEMGMPPWAAVAIAAGAAIFVSSLLHRWIEMPAQAIGRVVTWRLPRPERSSDPAPASRILASE